METPGKVIQLEEARKRRGGRGEERWVRGYSRNFICNCSALGMITSRGNSKKKVTQTKRQRRLGVRSRSA